MRGRSAGGDEGLWARKSKLPKFMILRDDIVKGMEIGGNERAVESALSGKSCR